MLFDLNLPRPVTAPRAKQSRGHQSKVGYNPLGCEIFRVHPRQKLRVRHVDALNLRHASYAGAERKDAKRLARFDQFGLRGKAGAGADEAHVAGDDVPDLRQLVQFVFSQYRAKRRHRAFRRFVARRVRCSVLHCPELEAREQRAVSSDAALAENRGSGRLQADERRADYHHNRGRQRQGEGDDDIKQPLHRALPGDE